MIARDTRLHVQAMPQALAQQALQALLALWQQGMNQRLPAAATKRAWPGCPRTI